MKRVLEALRKDHDLVIVDCTSWFNETTLAILDAADIVLTMLSLEITSIKNMRLFLEVADQLGYEHGQDQARPQPGRLEPRDPRRGRRAARSVARSTTRSSATVGAWSTPSTGAYPSSCRNREAQVSQDILRLAQAVAGERVAGATRGQPASRRQKKSLFSFR